MTFTSETYTYNHSSMVVDRVISKFEDWNETWGAHNTISAVPAHPDCIYTNRRGHEIWCSPELYSFITEVKKAIPNIEFTGVGSRVVTQYNHVAETRAAYHTTVAAYFEGDVYALGVIAYSTTKYLTENGGGYHASAGDEFKKYVVESPYIHNRRYSSNSSWRCAHTSDKLDKALVYAKKFLRSYAPLDVLKVSEGAAEDKLSTTLVRQQSELYRMQRDELNTYLLDMARAVHVLANGGDVASCDSYTLNLVEKYMAKHEEVTKESSKVKPITCVVLRRDNSVFTVDHTIKDRNITRIGDVVSVSSTDQLPSNIQGAVAVMSMLNVGEVLDEVGFKQHDRIYWVYTDES